MFAHVRNIVLVTLVAALIWVIAESESLRADSIRAELTVAAPPGGPWQVRVLPQTFGGSVTLRLEGSTGRISELRESLRKRPLRLEPGSETIPQAAGEYAVDLRTALRASPQVRDSGVTLADTDPHSLTVLIEEMVSRELPIRAEVPQGDLDGPAEVEPPRAILRLPAALAAGLPADAALVARVPASVLTTLPEGRRSPIAAVALDLPELLRSAEGVRVEPPRVKLFLTLRSRVASAVVPSVPVHVRVAPEELSKWVIEIAEEDRFLKDVTVRGPRELVERVSRGESPLIAYVPLTFEELENAGASGEPVTKGAVFGELPGSPLKFEAADLTTRLTVKPRGSGTEAGAPPRDR